MKTKGSTRAGKATEKKKKPASNLKPVHESGTQRRPRLPPKIITAEADYHSVFENAPIGIFQSSPQGRYLIINPNMARMYGYDSPEDMLASITDIRRQIYAEPDLRAEFVRQLAERGSIERFEAPNRRKDGSVIWTSTNARAVKDAEGKTLYYEGFITDITERKQAEKKLSESEERYRTTLDNMLEGCQIIGFDWRYLYLNDAVTRHGRRTKEELLGHTMMEMYPGIENTEAFAVFRECMENRVARLMENEFSYPDGSRGWFDLSIAPVPEGIFILSVDITERKQAEEQVKEQVKRLNALHTIDETISASFDLGIILDVLLEQAAVQMQADAAAVLLANPSLLTLKYAAGRGFRAPVTVRSPLRFGNSVAGSVVLERKTVQISEVSDQQADRDFASAWESERFKHYLGTPLIAKGQVKGVLEIYHRMPLTFTPAQLNFLKAIANHAAIAIDNIFLFEDLQRANRELSLAYDATIEGWSLAMDMREKETEGHTRRITELTRQLVQAAGVSHEEMVHIRRGALLHDVGKIGVPDEILLKAAPLSDEEWKIIRRHPALAREILSRIPYLKPALDIPYCHHEKWDGSGYPRGLKGEEIPLAARLFAVVDVYDALTSERPYREAWPVGKALEYIREQSGKHFDPKVAETFLKLNVG